MCGFVTVFNPRTSPNLSIKEMGQMCDLIENRGPDNYGLFEDEHIITGCRRLSIIDLSNSANLPFSKNNYTISYNGEIYNYIEIREKLVNEYGIKFHTNSDTEVVLEAYINYGPNCLTNFNGLHGSSLLPNRSLFLLKTANPAFLFPGSAIAAYPQTFLLVLFIVKSKSNFLNQVIFLGLITSSSKSL